MRIRYSISDKKIRTQIERTPEFQQFLIAFQRKYQTLSTIGISKATRHICGMSTANTKNIDYILDEFVMQKYDSTFQLIRNDEGNLLGTITIDIDNGNREFVKLTLEVKTCTLKKTLKFYIETKDESLRKKIKRLLDKAKKEWKDNSAHKKDLFVNTSKENKADFKVTIKSMNPGTFAKSAFPCCDQATCNLSFEISSNFLDAYNNEDQKIKAVFLHEFGHLLGFRHEGEPGQESPPDPKSIMHPFLNNFSNLELSSDDKTELKKYY